ncbi:MAG TPA: formate dehydrogenase accessory sulfurtransferase FdhD, partial [Candidatus Limnocylindrales bacterium]
MSDAVGDAGTHADSATPEASVAPDGAGLALTLGLDELAVTSGVEDGMLPWLDPPDDEAGGVDVHADSTTRPASQMAAADLGTARPPGSHEHGQAGWASSGRSMRHDPHPVHPTADRFAPIAFYTGAVEDIAPPTRHVTTTRIVAVRGSSLEFRGDRVVGEEPLEIRAAGPGQEPVAVAITMRTPGFEEELAVGFLRTEGLIDGPEFIRTTFGDPAAMNQPDDQVTVHLARAFDASRVAERHFVATASCGICGKASLDEVEVRSAPIPEGPVVPRTVVLALPDLLRAAQRNFDQTGGLHAAGLFTPAGELIALREDVGRHNALDKLVGSQVLAKAMPLHQRL